MEFLQTFKDIAPFLQHPLVLIGFVILLFFGILTALLKAGILPQLSKKAAAELAKRAINLGFIVAILIIALGFWQYARHSITTGEPEAKIGNNDSPTKGNSPKDTPAKPKIYFKVTLHIPSDLNNAEITVDGKPATIVDQRLTFVVLRMEKRETSQVIALRNDFRRCTTRVLVDGDKSIQPCLN